MSEASKEMTEFVKDLDFLGSTSLVSLEGRDIVRLMELYVTHCAPKSFDKALMGSMAKICSCK